MHETYISTGYPELAKYQPEGTSKNLLRDPIAALGGARSLAYLFDMSRSLCSVRLALGPLVTVFRGAPEAL